MGPLNVARFLSLQFCSVMLGEGERVEWFLLKKAISFKKKKYCLAPTLVIQRVAAAKISAVS